MESKSVLPLIVVLVAVLIAAGTDLWNFRIHNAVTIPLLLTGILYQAAMDGMSGIAISLLGVVAASALLLIPYIVGGMGAGDLKLMAGVGAWLGPWAVLHVLIVSGLATGCWTVVLMIWGRAKSNIGISVDDAGLTGQQPSELTAVLSRADRRRKAVPFGALVALGVIITAFWIGGQL